MHPVFLAEFLAKLAGDQMKRFLLHRAALNGIHRAFRRAGEGFQTVLHQRDKRRFAAAHRPHEKQEALADVKPLG
ncbi:hypothetical protein D3C71_1382820 [compost metagenome]